MPESLRVELAERTYTLWFAPTLTIQLRAEVSRLVTAGRKLCVLTDENVAAHQSAVLDAVFSGIPACIVAPGESAKTVASLGRVLEFMAGHGLDRSGALFAVGGGVVGDLGGFAAATYLRGINYYQVPTTLLAMVDSSVGGKTGINLAAGKNLAGAFHQPRGVFVATGTLATLPAREFAAGMAEVIKYGLLGNDTLLARLEREPLALGSADLPEVIHRCCALKARIVEADERELAEAGGRALLNLGHTFGHAIEQVTGYAAYLHGEAVAIGLVAAARLSEKLGHVSSSDVARVEAVLTAHALPAKLRAPLALPDLLAAMARDKKARAGLPRFVVLKKLGEAATQDGVPQELAEACFREVGAQ